jgi:hypothetical protein
MGNLRENLGNCEEISANRNYSNFLQILVKISALNLN